MSIIDISLHEPEENQKYFLDCNILMYTFYTNGEYAANLVYDYSSLITKIISSHAQILITDVLLSEFINTYIQTEFHRLAKLNKWPRSKSYFKHIFKTTEEYKDILREIKCIITRQIAPIFTFINSDFPNMNFNDIFDNPKTFDFNDRYYGYCMAPLNAYIVTNDADFSDIEQCNIITNNQTLLCC